MATKIPNLWSQNDIKVEVLSPLAILRTQAANLEQMTQGVIESEIAMIVNQNGETIYQLDIIAPALGGYRHRLFAISHQKDMVYPVRFILDSNLALELKRLGGGSWFEVAGTENAFLELLGNVLRSKSINAVIQSFIARSNEIQTAKKQDEVPLEAVA